MPEFTANANLSAFTKLPLFQAMRGYVSKMSFDLLDLIEELTCEWLANSKTRSITANMEEIWKFMRKKMARSQEKQAMAMDWHRKDVEDKYKVRDKV